MLLPGGRGRAAAGERRRTGGQAARAGVATAACCSCGKGRLPARIFALDVASGQRTLVREIAPRDTVGVDAMGDVRLTPDGKSYAYVYIRSLYSLYQVTGLK